MTYLSNKPCKPPSMRDIRGPFLVSNFSGLPICGKSVRTLGRLCIHWKVHSINVGRLMQASCPKSTTVQYSSKFLLISHRLVEVRNEERPQLSLIEGIRGLFDKQASRISRSSCLFFEINPSLVQAFHKIISSKITTLK